MKIEIYIWNSTSSYSLEDWRSVSLKFVAYVKYNRIAFNHRFKEYRKNFKCTTHQLTALIKKAKTMNKKDTTVFTI